METSVHIRTLKGRVERIKSAVCLCCMRLRVSASALRPVPCGTSRNVD